MALVLAVVRLVAANTRLPLISHPDILVKRYLGFCKPLRLGLNLLFQPASFRVEFLLLHLLGVPDSANRRAYFLPHALRREHLAAFLGLALLWLWLFLFDHYWAFCDAYCCFQ